MRTGYPAHLQTSEELPRRRLLLCSWRHQGQAPWALLVPFVGGGGGVTSSSSSTSSASSTSCTRVSAAAPEGHDAASMAFLGLTQACLSMLPGRQASTICSAAHAMHHGICRKPQCLGECRGEGDRQTFLTLALRCLLGQVFWWWRRDRIKGVHNLQWQHCIPGSRLIISACHAL